MTPTHKQIVESLKRIAQSKGTREDYARCSAAGLTGDWPNPQGPGMYPAGWVVLGVVEELDEVAAAGMSLADDLEDTKEQRDLWRLRCEWQEACHKWERAMRLHHRDVVWDDEINRLECDAVQARAAYVAAGGTP